MENLPSHRKPEDRCRRLGDATAWLRRHRKMFWLITGGALLSIMAISCATVDRVLVAPPQIPGATFVGSKACEECHENVTKGFKTADHARLQARGSSAVEAGCESCHGPGSRHVESGGERHTIINPRKSPEICFQCHLDKRGQFNLPSHHPVLESKIGCGDCHEPHKGGAIKGGATSLTAENETCFKCHPAQRGPFVFEHEASREGCTVCHQPHGSVNARLLSQRNANGCLKCHFQQQTGAGILIGSINHTAFLSHGSCYSAGCHEAVHGSQVNPHLRF